MTCWTVAVALVLVGCASGTATPDSGSPQRNLLVYTRTLGFRHDSIPAALAAVRDLATREGLSVLATEDPSTFTAAGLSGIKAVVFLQTTGEVLDPAVNFRSLRKRIN